MRSRLAVSSSPTAAAAPGMRRCETVKPTSPAFGFAPRAGRAFVADLAARAGRGAGKRRDRRRMVVRLAPSSAMCVSSRDARVAAVGRRDRSARRRRLRSPPRCPSTRRACPAGCAACVCADHREQRSAAAARRRSIQSALKILCRQCSEFACANIVSSTSVGSRPSARNASRRGSRSRRARAPGRASRSRARARCDLALDNGIVASGRGATCANSCSRIARHRRAPSRSCGRG